MRIDPDFERDVMNRLHQLLTHRAGDLPASAEKVIDDAESLLVSLLRQRAIMRHALSEVVREYHQDRIVDHSNRVPFRRAQQLLLDVPSNSPMTDDFAGASRTIPKKENEDGLR